MTETTRSLDKIDRNILRQLQANGRLSNVDLARLVNLSPTPCLERVRRLDRTTSDIFEHFKHAVQQEPGIAECHMVAGGFDYLLKVRTRDMESFRHFLGDVINPLPGVISTATYVAMETVKEGDAVPV